MAYNLLQLDSLRQFPERRTEPLCRMGFHCRLGLSGFVRRERCSARASSARRSSRSCDEANASSHTHCRAERVSPPTAYSQDSLNGPVFQRRRDGFARHPQSFTPGGLVGWRLETGGKAGTQTTRPKRPGPHQDGAVYGGICYERRRASEASKSSPSSLQPVVRLCRSLAPQTGRCTDWCA